MSSDRPAETAEPGVSDWSAEADASFVKTYRRAGGLDHGCEIPGGAAGPNGTNVVPSWLHVGSGQLYGHRGGPDDCVVQWSACSPKRSTAIIPFGKLPTRMAMASLGRGRVSMGCHSLMRANHTAAASNSPATALHSGDSRWTAATTSRPTGCRCRRPPPVTC